MIFIYSTSNLGEHNLNFVIFIRHSVYGALPLGKCFTEFKTSKTAKYNNNCFRVFSVIARWFDT